MIASAAGLAVYFLSAVAADAQVQVTVNGSAVDVAPPPIVQAGRVFVPLRGVFEQLGASVVYSNGTINAQGNGRDISLQIGSTQATVNGQPQEIDVAPFIVGESTYVPLRFISEALGDSVSWDDADSIAAIDTGGGAADYFTPGTASYVDTAPPPIPEYDQPEVPAPNDLWQPGYWAWGSYGYYWVPGTWVEPPQPNYLWTPGYWQWNNGGYNWNPGYWALVIGFYGGVNYGGGYFGHGYDGGRWQHDNFQYNTFVSHVDITNIHNVYVNRNVYVNPTSARVSYNGGPAGLQMHPTPAQIAAAKGRHLGMTVEQQQHIRQAEQDRRQLATVNHSKPPVLAVARPLSTANRPSGFVPVKAADRVNPQANVAPVRMARPATPTHAAPVPRPATARVAPVPRPATARVAPVPRPATARVAPVPPAAAAHVAPVPHAAPARVAPVAPARVAPAPQPRIVPHVAPAANHVPAVYAAPPVHVRAAAPPAAPRGPAAAPRPKAPAQHAPPERQKPG